MNWIFLFLLGWHPPLEIPPVPPLDWQQQSESESELRFYWPTTLSDPRVLFTTTTYDIALRPDPKQWTVHDPDITLLAPYKPTVTKERNGWRITFKHRPVDGKK